MGLINQCHCCLLRPPAKDLRTPYTRRGITEIYSLMIEECFVIKLTSGNDDQSGICEECLRLLREASSFKVQVQRCQTELRQRLEAGLRVKEEKMDEPLEDDLCSEFAEPSLPSDEVSLDQPIKEEPRDEYMSPPDKESPPCKEEPRDEYMSPPDEVSPGPPCEEEPRDEYMSRRDDEAATATSIPPRVLGRTAKYYREYRARKRAEWEKALLNRTCDPSTADSSINVARSVDKKKAATEKRREYRARRKAQCYQYCRAEQEKSWTTSDTTVDSSINAGPVKKKRKPAAEYQREYRARIKAKRQAIIGRTAGPSVDPQTIVGPKSDGFSLPKKKTRAAYQREYRARKKAQRESSSIQLSTVPRTVYFLHVGGEQG
ncbi:uncharacterized protein LOC125239984 isoform X2 [Leguminivora glycinivorella]|uniref:uncharacterized protein LOC125239984 isoform X2 n=1 Tax=Leguminivora glycinivorella TaxID=1035111 RepID=UPI00200D5FF5|nr:uncharacterized protein LOC125239984 isoform X2 [Leguminivora glycinivorella]